MAGYTPPTPSSGAPSSSGWGRGSPSWRSLTPEQRKQWKTFQPQYLRDHPLCMIGYTDICTRTAKSVDHLDGCDYRTDFLNPAWCRAACMPCHRRRTAQQGNAAQRTQGTSHTVTSSQWVNKPKPERW